jgi:hypothetical protein
MIVHLQTRIQTRDLVYWCNSRCAITFLSYVKVKVKLKLSLSLTEHHVMKTYYGVEV